MKVLVTGGGGRLASHLGRIGASRRLEMLRPSRCDLDIIDTSHVQQYIRDRGVDVVIHAAASLENSNTEGLLRDNVLGTASVALSCERTATKLVYISSDYVYCSTPGPHHEDEALLPFTDYGWSKLGGECAARICRGSLVVRGAFSQVPYPHSEAYGDVVKNQIYQDRAAELILDCLGEEGVLNLAAFQSSTLYEFARRSREDVIRQSSPGSYFPSKFLLSTDRLRALVERKSRSEE